MRLLSDKGNEGGWYGVGLNMAMEADFGRNPAMYMLEAMVVQNALATLGYNLAVVAALEAVYQVGYDNGVLQGNNR